MAQITINILIMLMMRVVWPRELYKIAKYAMMLHDFLQEDQLEGWVQSKTTKAADYMGTVAHYLEYEMGMQS